MSKQDIEELKSSLRIEEVIGRYVKLERKGATYTGLCPFHADHHPSLKVSASKQTYACFACGEKGDVIEFIQKMEHCSFGEAIGRLKIDMGKLKSRKTEPVEKKSNAKCSSILHPSLPMERNVQFLSSLLPYACGNSELTPACLDFEVGQSPVRVQKEWYAMRNRVVFPIRDEAGVLIAFAARKLTDDNPDEPKYINSSVADGYRKSEHLYAFHRAKEAIVQEGFAFIVEGYKDAIAMHAAGFTNTVALGGTALTDQQVALLKKQTTHLCLLLDGDKPGREAARKIALSTGAIRLEVTTLSLPEGDDPDSLFRRLGKEAFADLIRNYRSKPHLSEELLLGACLLYADTFYIFKGSLCLFTEVLNCVLQTDDLLFENQEHRMILSHLGAGDPESSLTPVLKARAEELHTQYDLLIDNDKKQFASLYPETSNLLKVYLTRLLFLYTENRILQDIQKTVTQLLKVAAANKEKRLSLLLHIAERREQLRHVSENLDRPGAVLI